MAWGSLFKMSFGVDPIKPSGCRLAFEPACTPAEVVTDRLIFAANSASWYRRKKRSKRRMSVAARVGAVVFAIAGGAIPLISPLLPNLDARVGYPILAMSGGCMLLNRVFGWSRDWGRYMIAATRIEAASENFRVASLMHYYAPNFQFSEIVHLAASFTRTVNEIVEKETTDWNAEHSLALAELERLAGASSGHRDNKTTS